MAHVEGRLPLELFVGVQPPEHWSRLESSGEPHAAALTAHREGRKWERPELARESIRWGELGVLPRFVGSETTSCAAALQPSAFHGQGADEFDRFVQAASRRGETALIVSAIGDPGRERWSRTVFSEFDDHVLLPGAAGLVAGRQLPSGGKLDVANGIEPADRDLALRVREGAGALWALGLHPTGGEGLERTELREPGGRFEPLLVNALGEAVAGVWIPAEGRNWRWYIVPGGTSWEVVISWVVERGVPAFVPAALRRIRSSELVDDDLLTPDELDARDALAAFDQETASARTKLEAALTAATRAAVPDRFDLLYGTGDALKEAVARVLRGFGFTVEDLDATFGAGKSADLLVSFENVHCLVEVKSAGGMPSEGLIADLDRHVQTWASLGRTDRVHRSVLVVNHQHSLPPLAREAQSYGRPEFLASLQHAVVPTLALFAWWRDRAQEEVAAALFSGPAQCHRADLAMRTRAHEGSAPGNAAETAHQTERARGARRWRWPRIT